MVCIIKQIAVATLYPSLLLVLLKKGMLFISKMFAFYLDNTVLLSYNLYIVHIMQYIQILYIV